MQLKFFFIIYRTLDHIEGDILLTIPKIPELMDNEISDVTLCSKKEIIEQLEDGVGIWSKHIQKVKKKIIF